MAGICDRERQLQSLRGGRSLAHPRQGSRLARERPKGWPAKEGGRGVVAAISATRPPIAKIRNADRGGSIMDQSSIEIVGRPRRSPFGVREQANVMDQPGIGGKSLPSRQWRGWPSDQTNSIPSPRRCRPYRKPLKAELMSPLAKLKIRNNVTVHLAFMRANRNFQTSIGPEGG